MYEWNTWKYAITLFIELSKTKLLWYNCTPWCYLKQPIFPYSSVSKHWLVAQTANEMNDQYIWDSDRYRSTSKFYHYGSVRTLLRNVNRPLAPPCLQLVQWPWRLWYEIPERDWFIRYHHLWEPYIQPWWEHNNIAFLQQQKKIKKINRNPNQPPNSMWKDLNAATSRESVLSPRIARQIKLTRLRGGVNIITFTAYYLLGKRKMFIAMFCKVHIYFMQ